MIPADLDDYDRATIRRMLAKRTILPDGCWRWDGCHNTANQYGRVGYRGATWYTHRLIFTLINGPIPDGLHIDHLCRNRRCFKPEHLEPVTQRVNTLRGDTLPARQLLITHCPKGHPYDDLNTRASKYGRKCRECARERESGGGDAHECPECGRLIGTLMHGSLASHCPPMSRERCPGRWPVGKGPKP